MSGIAMFIGCVPLCDDVCLKGSVWCVMLSVS